jgi:predicted TIM-barrel fold metal-dependent hydrolase
MSDAATFPAAGSPWMELDRLVPDYDARVGGPKVDKVVLIESSVGVKAENIIQSNRWMLQTAAAEKKILSVVGNLDVTQGAETFVQQLDALAGDKSLVGLRIGGRLFDAGAPRTFASIQPNVLKNLSQLVKRGMMIDTLGIPGTILREVGAATGITIVMDHFAGKPNTLSVEDSWKADMQDAARYRNLNIKVSDVHKLCRAVATAPPAGSTQFQPIADPERYEAVLTFLWNTFGPERLIFGTNWPVSDAGGLFVDSIDLEIDIMESFLTKQRSAGRDSVMFKNALRVYSPRK